MHTKGVTIIIIHVLITLSPYITLTLNSFYADFVFSRENVNVVCLSEMIYFGNICENNEYNED